MRFSYYVKYGWILFVYSLAMLLGVIQTYDMQEDYHNQDYFMAAAHVLFVGVKFAKVCAFTYNV